MLSLNAKDNSCNSYCPLLICDDPFSAVWVENNPEESSAFIETIPLKKVGDCEKDIGNAVCHLISDGMGYITGTTIMIDGGQAYLR